MKCKMFICNMLMCLVSVTAFCVIEHVQLGHALLLTVQGLHFV